MTNKLISMLRFHPTISNKMQCVFLFDSAEKIIYVFRGKINKTLYLMFILQIPPQATHTHAHTHTRKHADAHAPQNTYTRTHYDLKKSCYAVKLLRW